MLNEEKTKLKKEIEKLKEDLEKYNAQDNPVREVKYLEIRLLVGGRFLFWDFYF